MRVHEAIVAVLRDVGVDVIFGGAGEESMGMQIAVAQAEGVRGIIPKHEQNASFMACGYALFSGKLGVCFSTAGPGAFNLMSGVCVALNGSLPLIAITGYATMAYDGRGQANETSGLVHTPNSKMVWDAVVKKDATTGEPANYLITKVEDVVPIMHKAVEVALTGRPGPVQVAVAWNITAPTLQVTNYSPPQIDRRPVAPNPAEIESAAAFLAEAIGAGKQTVLWAGYGAIRAGAGPEVRTFMERYQVPLVTTMDGKGIVAEDHPLAMGLFCDSGHKSAWQVFLDSDVVVALGNSFSQHGTFDFRPDLFENRKLVCINVDPEELDKYYKADYGIVGDAKLAMAALLEALDGRVGPVPPKSFRRAGFDLQKVMDRVVDLAPKIHPGRMIEAISRMLPERGVVIADVGVHMGFAAYYLALRDGQNFRKPPSYGPMAMGTTGALGGEMCGARPDRDRDRRRRLLSDVGLRAHHRSPAQHRGDLGDLQRWRVQADQALPARHLQRERADLVRQSRLCRLCPRLRRRRLCGRHSARLREGAHRRPGVGAADPDRRQDQPPRPAAFQRESRRPPRQPLGQGDETESVAP